MKLQNSKEFRGFREVFDIKKFQLFQLKTTKNLLTDDMRISNIHRNPHQNFTYIIRRNKRKWKERKKEGKKKQKCKKIDSS